MGFMFNILPDDVDPNMRTLLDVFTLLGILWMAKIWIICLVALTRGLRTHIISQIFPIDLKKKYGPWAIITGATDGVGLQYSRQLAAKGLNLILIGRSREKLHAVQLELCQANINTDVVTIQADFNTDDPELYTRIGQEIASQKRQIGLLINNAGVMYDSPNRFLDQPESKIWEQVRVNMVAVAMMTRIVLPQLVQRKRGLVVNLSSIAGYQPLSLMGVYSASKASQPGNVLLRA